MKQPVPQTVKVLIVLYYYQPYISGVSVYAKRLAEGLAKDGYQVTVLTSRYDKSLPKQERINDVQVVRRPVLLKLGKGVIMPLFWLDIIRFSKRNDYINPHLPMADSGLACLFIPKNKIVTTYQCDIFLGNGVLDRLIQFISMSLMRIQLIRSKSIITLAADYFKHSKMSRYSYKTMQIYAPVNTSEFKPLSPKPLFNKLKVGDEDIKIGFVGRIVYEKGINYLLDAIPQLKKQLGNIKIIIVGDYEKVAGGSIKDELDQYMKQYPDNIIFTGYLSDEERNRFYSGLDVFVLPSIDPLEAFGMVQVEAMLCGSPVVASNLPGVREVVRKTGYGRISKIKDPQDIASQIVEVVKHPEIYIPDRQKVASIFDPIKSIKSYESLMPNKLADNRS